jgi:RNA-directed DNA polymerase
VILVDGYRRWEWLLKGACRRLCEELLKLDVSLNKEKSKIVDLAKGESFSFLGFEFRQVKTFQGKLSVFFAPTSKAKDFNKPQEVFALFKI